MDQVRTIEGVRARHLVVDGRRLHCLEWGEAEAPPVILLHGGGQCAHTWDRVCASFSGGFRCIALDFRGHGDSEWSYEFQYRPEDYVRDVAGLVDTYGLDRFALVGMSLGGFVGMTYALDFPGRVERLVLVDVIPGGRVGLAHGIARRLSKMEGLVEGASSLDEAVARVHAAFPHRERTRLLEVLSHGTVCGADGRLLWKRDRRRPVDVELLAKQLQSLDAHAPSLQCPTLLVKGGSSPAFDDAAGRAFVERVPFGTYRVVPDAGHAVQEDQPELLTKAIEAFLRIPFSERLSSHEVDGFAPR